MEDLESGCNAAEDTHPLANTKSVSVEIRARIFVILRGLTIPGKITTCLGGCQSLGFVLSTIKVEEPKVDEDS